MSWNTEFSSYYIIYIYEHQLFQDNRENSHQGIWKYVLANIRISMDFSQVFATNLSCKSLRHFGWMGTKAFPFFLLFFQECNRVPGQAVNLPKSLRTNPFRQIKKHMNLPEKCSESIGSMSLPDVGHTVVPVTVLDYSEPLSQKHATATHRWLEK